MAKPLISVVIPVRNEAGRLPATIRSILASRAKTFDIEFSIADDGSTDGCCDSLADGTAGLAAPGVTFTVTRLPERTGVPRARNAAARAASGEILFITDAHVRFSQGWDRQVLTHIDDRRVLAATLADPASAFKGYGCKLIVPFMGTHWVRKAPKGPTPVQIASSAGTILPRSLFEQIGGFDDGMIYYAAAEPEFSVRAWLSGAEVISLPELMILHRFKPQHERGAFLDGLRPYMMHNNIRFGLLYLGNAAILQMLRHHAMLHPKHMQEACQLVERSDVWERRAYLERHLVHDFDWFIDRFELKDQLGHEIPTDKQLV